MAERVKTSFPESRKNYDMIKKWLSRKEREWIKSPELRKKYKNDVFKYDKYLKKQINKSLKKTNRDYCIKWNLDYKQVEKTISGVNTKFHKYRSIEQHGALIDVLEYVDPKKRKYFASYPSNSNDDNYFDTISELNDCHNIYVIDNEKLLSFDEHKVIHLSYHSRYIE